MVRAGAENVKIPIADEVQRAMVRPNSIVFLCLFRLTFKLPFAIVCSTTSIFFVIIIINISRLKFAGYILSRIVLLKSFVNHLYLLLNPVDKEYRPDGVHSIAGEAI